jgi:hypothetical protein
MTTFMVKAKNCEDDSTIAIGAWDESIEVTQDGETVWLQDAKQARKVIKAIRKAAKEQGWEV